MYQSDIKEKIASTPAPVATVKPDERFHVPAGHTRKKKKKNTTVKVVVLGVQRTVAAKLPRVFLLPLTFHLSLVRS